MLTETTFRRGRPRKYYCTLCMTGEPLTKDNVAAHYEEEHQRVVASDYDVQPFSKFVPVAPVCEACYEEFTSFKSLKAHMQSHHVDNKYECGTCHELFPTMVYHTLHMFEHERRSKCLICSDAIKTKEQVTTHYGRHDDHHMPYKCGECSRRFPNVDHLKAHAKLHRRRAPKKAKKAASSEPVKYQCEKCAQFYVTPWYLKTHLETVHKEIAYEDFKCPVCGKICKGEAALKRHKRRTHNTPHQVCDICGKSIKASQMNLHQLRHGDKTFACQFCDKMFAIKMALVEHERIHNGKKPYACKHCGKGFSQAGSRRIHERLHTNERPYVCELCGKAFTSGGMLNVHRKKCIPKLNLGVM